MGRVCIVSALMAPAMADLYANFKYFFILLIKREKLALNQELGLYTYSKII